MSTKGPTLNFTCNARFENDFWLLNGDPDLAVIPEGQIKGIYKPMPIRLAYGNPSKYGSTHIMDRHGVWVNKFQPNQCVATLVHLKLSQRGRAHATEDDNKMNLNLSIHPSGFMVLKNFGNYFSVTTLYFRNRKVDGQFLGTYKGHIWGVKPTKDIEVISLDSVSESVPALIAITSENT